MSTPGGARPNFAQTFAATALVAAFNRSKLCAKSEKRKVRRKPRAASATGTGPGPMGACRVKTREQSPPFPIFAHVLGGLTSAAAGMLRSFYAQ